MTRRKALQQAILLLSATSDSPALDAEMLLAKVIDIRRDELPSHLERQLTLLQRFIFWRLIRRRRRGAPIAYLVGKREFYGRKFVVNKNVLIPRPDTETLIEETLKVIDEVNASTIVDVGTGSGCIAISLSAERPSVRVIATDTSHRALRTARHNSAIHHVENNIDFITSDLLPPSKYLDSKMVVVANLPYLLTQEIKNELVFEPRQALDGGTDGLALYRKLLTQLADLPAHARPYHILLELHPPTAKQVEQLALSSFPLTTFRTYNDLSGKPRVLRLTLA